MICRRWERSARHELTPARGALPRSPRRARAACWALLGMLSACTSEQADPVADVGDGPAMHRDAAVHSDAASPRDASMHSDAAARDAAGPVSPMDAAPDSAPALEAAIPQPDGAVPDAAVAPGDAEAGATATDGNMPDADRDTRWDAPYMGKYQDDKKWLCRPGLPNSLCAGALSVTDLLPDGGTAVSAIPPTPEAVGIDCFYVYPTVDPGLFAPPRNLDFAQIPLDAVRDVFVSQALPFRTLCNLYAPLYRQASLTSLQESQQTAERGLEFGYADIADAFDYYLRDADASRPLVLLAHSQGSMITLRLIQRVIQDDPKLRRRLVVAVLAGPLGGFNLPKDKLVGGTLKNIPLCSTERETGCALTYNTFWKNNPPNAAFASFAGGIPEGFDTGCTLPPGYATGVARLGGALFPARSRPLIIGIPFDFGGATLNTDYGRYRDFFSGQCKPSSKGLSYFEIAPDPLPGDRRKNPVPFDHIALTDASIGLHALDYAFIASELFDAVKTKIDAFVRASP